MKYNVIDVDASSLQEKYKIGLLSAKLLKASHLDDKEVSELFATDTTLTTSKADCIQKCCKRLLQARDNNEKAVSYTHLDVYKRQPEVSIVRMFWLVEAILAGIGLLIGIH